MAIDSDLQDYGSDRAGLVWAYRFAPGRLGYPLERADAERWLSDAAARLDGEDFLWLHFSVVNAASENWLREHVSPPEAFQDSLRPGSSTRVELADDWMVAVLNDVVFFSRDTSEAATLSLCANRFLLVSARSSPLRSVDRLKAAVKGGELFRSPVELVAHLLRDQAHILSETVRDSVTRVDDAEDKVVSGQSSSCRATLGALRRVMVRLQRLLAPEPGALFRLLNHPPGWLGDDDEQDLRQSAEELAAAVAESSALAERIRLLQEELFALTSEQTNRTLFVLTVVTVLALPLTIISGLLGMNVGGVPLHDHPSGFWLAAVVSLSISAVGGWLALGRRNDP